uniref:YDG domain-containing protein n=1 Tax=viral metagenome TaxID=1070528 RepID=A0A6C0DQZ8_9ZZZZ
MPFVSYLEAHERLNLPGSYQDEINGSETAGITSLKLTDHADSYNQCTNLGRVIYYVGEGRRKSPGHPAGNQMENRQVAFRQSWHLQNLIPLLHKRSDGSVVLLGYYRVSGMRKRMGNEGFTYFEFELRQETDPRRLPEEDLTRLPPSPVASSPPVPTTYVPSGLACYRCNIIKNLFDLSSVKGVPLGALK